MLELDKKFDANKAQLKYRQIKVEREQQRMKIYAAIIIKMDI